MAKILIVDDRPINRECLSAILGHNGYGIVEAGSGAEALRMARASRPDLIITDVLMPGMDGLELFGHLKADAGLAATPLIFYTAAFRHEELASLSGGDSHTTVLAKPSEPKAILATVARALGRPETALPARPPGEAPSDPIADSQAVNLRLATLLELSLALAGERQPEKLLRLSCRGARDILNAPHVAVALVDEAGRLEHLEAIGLAVDAHAAIGTPCSGAAFFSTFHPSTGDVLAQPIQTPSRFYGWLYLAGWKGSAHLAAEREQIATNLAAQLAVAWENLQSQRKAREELELRVRERTRALQEANLALENEIKDHLKTEAELRRSNGELEQMAYVLTHDLQEPLRTVNNFVRLLAHRYRGQLGEEADQFIAFAVDGVSRMQDLIKDVLQFALINGREAASGEPVDASAAFQAALANLQAAIEESGAEIEWDSLPAVAVNREQLSQLFQNLISNAIKFRSDAAPRIRISASREGKAWRFRVEDNGIGIPPTYHQRIFEIFKRLHARTEYPGTGVGLAICKKIVERHGGRIWVEPAPAQGTAFCFTLPGEPAPAN